MTGRVVERAAPAPYRFAPIRPVGVSPLMPPHSQGAEQRKEHHAGRTGSRWGLRALVIGGLAGAAWLLTGAAAHAADRDPAAGGVSLGSSLIGSVVSGEDRGAPVLGRVLTAAAKPLETRQHRGHGSAVAVPGKLVATLHKATHGRNDDADSALGGVDDVVRELTAPLRPAGVAVDTRKPALVTEPQEAEPPQAVTAAAPPVIDTPAPAPAPLAAEPAGETTAAQVGAVASRGVKAPAPGRRNLVGKAVVRQHTIAVDRHPAAATAADPETVSETSGGDGPAPLRVHLGAANGVPASGPSTATEGGSSAFLPAKVADSTVACHRLPITTDVEVRRHDAEAPTVSPD